MKKFKNFLCVLLSMTVILMFGVVSNAVSIDEHYLNNLDVDAIADKYLNISSHFDENGSYVETIIGINNFKDKIITRFGSLSDVEIAKIIYSYFDITDAEIESMSDDELLDALKFSDCIRKTTYIKCSADGEQSIVDFDEISLQLVCSERLTSDGIDLANTDKAAMLPKLLPVANSNNTQTSTDSSDGYMRIVTQAMRMEDTINGRTYFHLFGTATWLKAPFFHLEDIFAMTSNTQFDNSWNYTGSFYEKVEEVDTWGNVITTNQHSLSISKNGGTTSPNDIRFEFANGLGGLGIYFNLKYFPKNNPDNTHVYKKMEAKLHYRGSLYNSDGGVQAAYAHKEAGIGGISVSFSPTEIGFSADIITDYSGYFGEPLSLYCH